MSAFGPERSCINVFGLNVERSVLRAIMGISAHSVSLVDIPASVTQLPVPKTANC